MKMETFIEETKWRRVSGWGKLLLAMAEGVAAVFIAHVGEERLKY